LGGLWRDCAGVTMMTTALLMPVIVGMAGLGIDVTFWFKDRRELQTIADLSAIAGAVAFANGATASEVQQTVADHAARNDFVPGPADALIVNVPPVYGPNAGEDGFVEVIVDQERRLYFAALFRQEPVVIQARAVGGSVYSGQHCILGLDESMDGAVTFSGTANANISCGVAANSDSSSAIAILGNAILSADPAQAYGDIYVQGNGELITQHPVQSFSQRITDPYGPDGRNLQVPAASPCDYAGGYTANGETVTLDPGRYCGDLTIINGNVTFNPGVYILDEGSFSVTGTSTLYGEDVTFILTGTDPNLIGDIHITGGTVATLIAPGPEGQPDYGGDYAGILFYQDQAAPSFQGANLIDNTTQGGSEMDLRGAIYFPNQEIVYTGGGGIGLGCLQIVARQVSFEGNAIIDNTEEACTAQGVESIYQARVRLVE
jgi:hypothetical protein